MLPSTITLNVGSPAADVVFADNTQLSGSSRKYFAPSPQNDLEGRPTILVSHETTKAGIVRSLTSIVFPVYNSTTGLYTGFVKGDIVLNRHISMPTAISAKVLECLQELPASGWRDSIVAGNI